MYAYLVCTDPCRICIWLGWTVPRQDGSVWYFHKSEPIGGLGGPRNSEQHDRSGTVWKALADHIGHRLVVLRDDVDADRLDAIADSLRDIGDGGVPTFADYLAGWPGFEAPGQTQPTAALDRGEGPDIVFVDRSGVETLRRDVQVAARYDQFQKRLPDSMELLGGEGEACFQVPAGTDVAQWLDRFGDTDLFRRHRRRYAAITVCFRDDQGSDLGRYRTDAAATRWERSG